MNRTRTFAALPAVALALTLTACGGGGSDSKDGGSDAPKVSFAAAMKSQAAATAECKKLIGDKGEKLNALGEGGSSTVTGYRENDTNDGNDFTCRTGNQYLELIVTKDSKTLQDRVQSAKSDLISGHLHEDIEWMVQSASNTTNSMGVMVQEVSMAKKDAAPQQLQAWADQLDK